MHPVSPRSPSLGPLVALNVLTVCYAQVAEGYHKVRRKRLFGVDTELVPVVRNGRLNVGPLVAPNSLTARVSKVAGGHCEMCEKSQRSEMAVSMLARLSLSMCLRYAAHKLLWVITQCVSSFSCYQH